jgi:hypothetical protein
MYWMMNIIHPGVPILNFYRNTAALKRLLEMAQNTSRRLVNALYWTMKL